MARPSRHNPQPSRRLSSLLFLFTFCSLVSITTCGLFRDDRQSVAPDDTNGDFITENPLQEVTTVPTSRTMSPTNIPAMTLTDIPTMNPTYIPAMTLTDIPTMNPTHIPTMSPTDIPSMNPTDIPSMNPTHIPTMSPTDIPSMNPTHIPTMSPTDIPSMNPTHIPTMIPSMTPSNSPTNTPTKIPSLPPTESPTLAPSNRPSGTPSIVSITASPTQLRSASSSTSAPTHTHSSSPTVSPTTPPTLLPTCTSIDGTYGIPSIHTLSISYPYEMVVNTTLLTTMSQSAEKLIQPLEIAITNDLLLLIFDKCSSPSHTRTLQTTPIIGLTSLPVDTITSVHYSTPLQSCHESFPHSTCYDISGNLTLYFSNTISDETFLPPMQHYLHTLLSQMDASSIHPALFSVSYREAEDGTIQQNEDLTKDVLSQSVGAVEWGLIMAGGGLLVLTMFIAGGKYHFYKKSLLLYEGCTDGRVRGMKTQHKI